MAASMVDETGRIPADSIWLNAALMDGQCKSICRFLERVAADTDDLDRIDDDGDDSFDILHQGEGKSGTEGSRPGARKVQIASAVTVGRGDGVEKEEIESGDDEDEVETEDEDEIESDTRSYQHSIEIRIVKAEGLLAKDRGGTSDPFARIEVDKRKSDSFVTKTIPKTVDPLWDESFHVPCNLESTILICE